MMVSESKPVACPNCGHTPVSECIYGLIGEPYVSEYLKNDEYMLMGCARAFTLTLSHGFD